MFIDDLKLTRNGIQHHREITKVIINNEYVVPNNIGTSWIGLAGTSNWTILVARTV